MGKFAKKLKKKNEDAELQQNFAVYKSQVKACKAEGKYEEGLEIVAKLVAGKCYDAELLFDMAELYFMAGDYERALMWTENTCRLQAEHRGALILQGRIYVLDDQTEKALAVFEHILSLGVSSLAENERRDMEEILEFYKVSEPELIQQNYPRTAAFLALGLQLQ